VLAETLVNAARAHMRTGDAVGGAALADRGLEIAERLNLDAIVVEGMVNRGSCINILGRRREAIAIQRGALELVQKVGDRNLEMRVRNNLASGLSEDEPLTAMAIYEEACDLARDIGDRGMYNWIVATAGVTAFWLGQDWTRHVSRMWEAYETATLPGDRARIRTLIGAIETARGERLDELARDMTEIVGDSQDTDMLFSLHMSLAAVALAKRNHDEAWRHAMFVANLPSQDEQIGLDKALEIAIAAGDVGRVQEAATRLRAVTLTGAITQTILHVADGAEAALTGRRAEAVASFHKAREGLGALGVRYDRAMRAVQATQLMPDEPEVRAWADEARALFTELEAHTSLTALDEALASGDAALQAAEVGSEVRAPS
jgi:hypothetical protein